VLESHPLNGSLLKLSPLSAYIVGSSEKEIAVKSTVKLTYRVGCRHANGLINQSRRDHIRSELEACSDPRQRWTVAKRLLHADNRPTKQTSITDDITLCEQFADFFV